MHKQQYLIREYYNKLPMSKRLEVQRFVCEKTGMKYGAFNKRTAEPMKLKDIYGGELKIWSQALEVSVGKLYSDV